MTAVHARTTRDEASRARGSAARQTSGRAAEWCRTWTSSTNDDSRANYFVELTRFVLIVNPHQRRRRGSSTGSIASQPPRAAEIDLADLSAAVVAVVAGMRLVVAVIATG